MVEWLWERLATGLALWSMMTSRRWCMCGASRGVDEGGTLSRRDRLLMHGLGVGMVMITIDDLRD